MKGGTEHLVVVKTGVPSYYRLCRTTSRGEMEEVVLTMPGMLIESDLPTYIVHTQVRKIFYLFMCENLTFLRNTLPKRARYARRGVHLTGFDSPIFYQCMQELAGIREVFRAGGVGQVEDYALFEYLGEYPHDQRS